MSTVVVAEATDGALDVVLAVWVCTGVTETGAAGAADGGWITSAMTYEPVSTGSLLLVSAGAASSGLTATPEADQATDQTMSSESDGQSGWWGHYTGTVTEGDDVTVGVTFSADADCVIGVVELPALAGQTPAVVTADMPPVSEGDSSGNLSGNFNPPAGSVLVAAVNCGGTAEQTVTTFDAMGLTWTQRAYQYNGSYAGTIAMFTATIPAAPGPGETDTMWRQATPFNYGTFYFEQDGSGLTVATFGNEFWVTQDVPLALIGFYSPEGAPVLPDWCGLWDVSTQEIVAGTGVTGPDWSGAAGSGWVQYSYDGSVTLQANTRYRVSVSYGGADTGWDGYTFAYWADDETGAPGDPQITSLAGLIVMPGAAEADGTSGAQTGYTGSHIAYPSGETDHQNFYIDVGVKVPAGPASGSGLLMACFP